MNPITLMLRPHAARTLFLIFSVLMVFLPCAFASAWQWHPGGGPLPVTGGTGTWSSGESQWWDGTEIRTWPAGQAGAAQSASFGEPAGTVTVSGDIEVDALTFAVPDYALRLSYGAGARLAVHGGVFGTGRIEFPSSGQVQRYSDAVLQRGVHFYGGTPFSVDVDFIGLELQGAPVLGVWGEGTVITLNGRIAVADDGGQTFVSIAPREGGHLIIGPDAEVNVILGESLFTRQLWVHGDGTGTIEFAEGFVANRTEEGTVARGMASYRISNTTLITHGTEGLPTSERPDGAGGLQINGHLVFENQPGSVWIVRSAPQEYNAGVWIQKDMTLVTEHDLTHTGVSTFSSHAGSYWAANAFQTDADNVTLVKRGAADLILAAEAAFRTGSVLRVEEGGVRFLTNPAAGVQKNRAPEAAGPHLQLEVRYTGTAALLAAQSELQSIDNFEGTVTIGGDVLLTGDFSQNHQEFIGQSAPPSRKLEPVAGTLIFRLGANETVKLTVEGQASLGGFLQLEREEGFEPAPGTTFDILFFADRVGQFAALNDFSDLGVVVEYLDDRIRIITTREAGRTGVIVHEDFTTGQFNHPGWRLGGNPQQVGIFPVNNRPGIPMALVHRVNHSAFTWGVAFLDTPTFRIGPDEVLVQKMTTFSDVANSNPQAYKIEIAVLHADTHAPFGHNRSAELSRNYSTNPNSHFQYQIFPSLYNDDVTRVNFAHHPGGSTADTLLNADRSMVVFRPQQGGASTRLEVFGEQESNTTLTIPFPLEHWNTLQISMPREWRESGSILARNVALADAQMGMSFVHVGITHRTDANIDYVTDAADFIIWNSYRGQSGTHLQTGDFTNSGSTGMADLELLVAALGQLHDPARQDSQRYHRLELPGSGEPPTFTYYQSSGRMSLTTAGSDIVAWQIPGPQPLRRTQLDGDWWQEYIAGKEQAADTALIGVGGEVTIAAFAAQLHATDFGAVHYGFASGGGGYVDVVVLAVDPLDPVPEPVRIVLLEDNFSDLSNWLDLSTAVTWSGAPANGSVFQISDGVLNLNAAGMAATMWGDNGIRSFSALDFPFPTAVNRLGNNITVEFRIRWQTVSATGEANRVAFMFLHDYPQGGVDLTPDLRVTDLSEPWFGRPAYQLRIRGGFNPPDAAPYMMYGGGRVAEGEFETAGEPPYWLPGFVSGAGGTAPGTNPSGNFPLSSWVMGRTAPASSEFKRFRYVLLPNSQQMWVNH